MRTVRPGSTTNITSHHIRIIKNHPVALRIQEKLVDEHKDISQTEAGEELNLSENSWNKCGVIKRS
jgi:hypothetical protein